MLAASGATAECFAPVDFHEENGSMWVPESNIDDVVEDLWEAVAKDDKGTIVRSQVFGESPRRVIP